MKKMSNYCKAYPAERLQQFPGWKEHAKTIAPTDQLLEGQSGEFYFLHDDLTVTADIFAGEKIIYDSITEDWKAFCSQTLEFSPVFTAAPSA
jgi:hypothetical protein